MNTRRLRKTATAYVLLLPGLGVILGFVGVVLYFAFAQSFGQYTFAGEDAWNLDSWRQLAGNDRFREAFFYSLRIATLSAVISVALAYPLALWLRDPFPGSTFAGAVLKIPYLVPGLVAAFLYVNFISFNGFINQVLERLNIIDSPIRMQNDDRGIGVLILQAWKQIPLALLLLVGAVRGVGNDIYDAARDGGAGPGSRFVHITLPMTLQTLQAAMIIIFIGAAGDFSFQTVAGPRGTDSLAQFMFSTKNLADDRNFAAVVGLMLMALALFGSLALAGATRLAVNRGRYSR